LAEKIALTLVVRLKTLKAWRIRIDAGVAAFAQPNLTVRGQNGW